VHWSRAAAGSTHLPGEAGKTPPRGEGVGVPGSKQHIIDGGEQVDVLVAGRDRLTRHTGEVGEIQRYRCENTVFATKCSELEGKLVDAEADLSACRKAYVA
jgi:hypothetical protein